MRKSNDKKIRKDDFLKRKVKVNDYENLCTDPLFLRRYGLL